MDGRGDGSSRSGAEPPAADSDVFGRGLLRALRNANISVLYQDEALRYVWAENVPRAWGARALAGAGDQDFLPGPEARRIIEAKKLVLSGGGQQRLEICVPDGDGARWFDLWVDADRDDRGRTKGVITTTVEITEQKRREQTLRALLREVSHRSKNLLAIIQSIASQTGRYSDGIGDFLTRFRGRIQSLAASQDLVTSSDWRGADLHQLIAGQLVRYCADPVANVRLEGSNPWLNPNAALHVGLALHELAVNSVTHGAFARKGGFVTVSATPMTEPDGSEVLKLVWRETDVDASIGQRRFGSVALERVVPASLNGRAILQADATGLTYELVIPRANFELE